MVTHLNVEIPKSLRSVTNPEKSDKNIFRQKKRVTRGQSFLFFPTLLNLLIGQSFCAPIGQPALLYININKATLPHD